MRFKTITCAAGLIAAASPLLTSAAAAQDKDQSDYDRGYQAGRADAARANQGGDQPPPRADDGQGNYDQQGGSYDDNAPAPPPPGDYDGSQPPPPPPGYSADASYAPDPQADRRYEAYAEDFVKNRNFFRQPGGYPPIRRDEIEDTSPSARAWLIGVAWQSLRTWENGLRDVCDKKFRYVHGPWGPIKVWVNNWTPAEADDALMASLWLAPRNTARYLCMWANRVR